MTAQYRDLAVQRGPDGWRFKADQNRYEGNYAIHLLADDDTSLLTLWLDSHLEGFSRFAHWTTAGMSWTQQIFSYFIDLEQKSYLVIRAWWGSRLVVALDDLKPVAPKDFENELTQFEREFTVAELKTILHELETGKTLEFDRHSERVMCTLRTCLYLPGQLNLVESIPILRLLEEHFVSPQHQFEYQTIAGFQLMPCCERRFVQNSLRRLGAKPIHPTYLVVDTDPQYVSAIPKDKGLQEVDATKIGKGIPVSEVIRLLGTPDYIRHACDAHDADGIYYPRTLRYEIYSDSPYTLLIQLNRNEDAAARCVKYSPPFWCGPEIFPSDHSLLDHDGDIVIGFNEDLDNGTFVGESIEI